MLQSKSYLNDPDLPYLKMALDGDIVRHYCKALISDKKAASIISCRVVRLRYRRAQRGIIQYEMILRMADRSLQTHWLVGYQYADAERFNAVARRLRKMAAACEPPDGLAASVVIEAIGLLLQRFPYDRRLPKFASLYHDLERVVGDHLAELLGSDDWILNCLDCQPVRWRTGLSAVTRLRLSVKHRHTGEPRRHTLFAKLDATGTDSDIVSRLHRLQSTGKLPFELAQTLHSDSLQGLTIQRSVDGVALDTMLSRGGLKLADARRLGSVLARWHGSGEALYNRYSKDKFESVLGRSVRVLGAAAPTCSLRLNRLAERIRRQMHHAVYCPVHLDLKPEHIFFSADRISLIDIESAADADPMLDIAILYARMRHARALYDLPNSASHFFALQLINTYHRLVPSSWWRNFSVCYAWALLKVAVHLFECQRPDWHNWIHRFVNEAELALIGDPRKLPFLSEGNHLSRPVDRRQFDRGHAAGSWSMA